MRGRKGRGLLKTAHLPKWMMDRHLVPRDFIERQNEMTVFLISRRYDKEAIYV